MSQAASNLSERDGDSRYRQFAKRYFYDPVGFAHDCIKWRDGEGITAYQEEIMADLIQYSREAVRGPHGLGKSCAASILILWFALTRDAAEVDWKIPTTASAWRQLTKFLWPEIGKWSRRLRWDVIGRDPFNRRTEQLQLSLKLNFGEAFAAASDTPEYLEGAHADSLLYVFDESKVVPDKTFDAAEGAFAGAGKHTKYEAYALAISTPGEPVGRFYDIHMKKKGLTNWHTRHVTKQECIDAGRMERDWSEQMKRLWGEKNAIYLNRCEGEFASSDKDGVIPLSWVELAVERYKVWEEEGRKAKQLTSVGVDVAREGADQTILALRFDEDIITELREYSREDTMETTGRVMGVLNAYGGLAVVDVIGIGSGVVDRLREQGKDVEAFNASERSDELDRSGELGFINRRAAAWWKMRERLDPAFGSRVCLPDDDELIGDLVSPHWKAASGGKIQVQSKDEIKATLKRSTDKGDAVVMAFATEDGAALPFGWIHLPQEVA